MTHTIAIVPHTNASEPVAAVSAEQLRVAGLTPFTTIDYPGKLAAVVFVQGCPWRCCYCHNPWMQPREFSTELEHSSWEKVLELLARRQGLLDAVVFSGGEPCIDPALPAAMEQVRQMGLAVGLHTAGAYPRRLREVIGSVDWVGIDVKAPPENEALFDRVTGRAGSADSFKESFEIVSQAQIPYETRTTAHPDFLSVQHIEQIAHWLSDRGTRQFALQIFRPAPHIDLKLARVGAEYPGADTEEKLRALFEVFTLRRDA